MDVISRACVYEGKTVKRVWMPQFATITSVGWERTHERDEIFIYFRHSVNALKGYRKFCTFLPGEMFDSQWSLAPLGNVKLDGVVYHIFEDMG